MRKLEFPPYFCKGLSIVCRAFCENTVSYLHPASTAGAGGKRCKCLQVDEHQGRDGRCRMAAEERIRGSELLERLVGDAVSAAGSGLESGICLLARHPAFYCAKNPVLPHTCLLKTNQRKHVLLFVIL